MSTNIAFLFAFLLLINAPAFSTNYYVDTNNPNANDNNPGTENLPFKTIQKGINVAYAGDSVFVKYGTYNQGTSSLVLQRSGNQGNPIVFIGLGTPLVQFSSTSSPTKGWDWGSGKNYIELHGFELTGSKWVIQIRGDHNKIVGNKVHHTGSDGISIWGGNYNLYSKNIVYHTGWNALHIESRADIGLTANYNVVEYNYVYDNDAHFGINIFPETGGVQDDLIGNIVRYNIVDRCGLYLRNFKNGEIYGNLFYDDGVGANNGIWFHSDGGVVPYPSNLKVYNNTFVLSADGYSIYNVSFKDIEIKNNIIYQSYNKPLMRMDYTTGIVSDYNLYYSTNTNNVVNWAGSNKTLAQFQSMGYEQHGLWINPQLDNNHKPLQNSPAINTGLGLGAPWNYDLDGNLRGSGGFWDIGTYEYSSGVVNLPPTVPSSPNPPTGTTGQQLNLTLSWNCSDPENNPLTYDVYLGTNNNPPLAASGITVNSYNTLTLNPNSTYYWKIVAHDNYNNSTSGPVWNFSTINQDLTPPEVTGAVIIDSVTVVVSFSELLNEATAENIQNYLISPSVNINSAALSGTNVTLNTSPHSTGTYLVTVNNVKDLAGNIISPTANTAEYEYQQIISYNSNTNVRIFLDGPFKGTEMRNDLNNLSIIPLAHPYNNPPWNYTGTEQVSQIPDEAVDWILLEVRANTGSSSVIAKKAAFVRTDGKVIDLNGNDKVEIPGLTPGSYYLVIHHRNHLSIMSAVKIEFSESPSLYDFTTSQSKAYGNEPMKNLGNNTFGLFAADGNASGNINNFDYVGIWRRQNGKYGYLSGDFDLNGGVNITDKNNYWGPNNGKVTRVP